MNWARILELLKHPTSVLVLAPLAIVTGAVVLAPQAILDALSLTALRRDHGHWFGLAFLVCAASLLTRCAAAVIIKLSTRRTRQRRLHRLTPAEQQLLGAHVYRQDRSQMYQDIEGLVQGLVQADVLFKSTETREDGLAWFNVTDWAWDYLKKHKELVKAPEERK